MALMRVQFYSDALGVSTSMTVLLPQPARSQIGMAAVAGDEPPQLLYLLHGLSDDDTIWTRRTALERHVAGHDLAVVMPAVNRSFYTDEAYGAAYWRFVSEELPSLVHRFFRVSDRSEDTFVAGLSMGGYGALKWALTHPDRFAAAASMSGALDVVTAVGNRTFEMDPAMWLRIFGEQGPPPASDLFALAERTPPADLPPLWVGCGTADHLWDANQRFVTHLDGLGISPTLSWVDGAAHEWSLWDRDIEQLMSWLPLRRSAGADG